jgi:hypothetical protein
MMVFDFEPGRASDGIGEYPTVFFEYPSPRQWWTLPLRKRIAWMLSPNLNVHPGTLLVVMLWRWTAEEWREILRS